MKAVLVTGGAGYVGAHTCKALAAAGYRPVSYDNLVRGHESAVRWGPLERGDILDRRRLGAVIARHKPEAVLHFAAYAYVGESVAKPATYYLNNVVGSLTLLEAMRDGGISKIIFSSSCASYGIPEELPIVEDSPQRPISPYGESKLMVERILADFETAYGFKWMALRYFNAAGADPQFEIGEDHEPETHLIPLVLNAACGRSAGFTIFGVDHATPDGTCIRDYVHVSDLASAHVRALQALEAGQSCGAYNLCNGRGYSVREVIDTAVRVTGLEVPVRLGERRRGDPAVLVGDATMAREVLGWKPEMPELAEIVRTAWDWHRRRWGLLEK